MSPTSLNTFTKTNSSLIIYESIRNALEIRLLWYLTYLLLTLFFYHDFFFFFLIIDLYILVPAVIVQLFSPTVELAISIGITAKRKSKNRN